MLRPAADHAAIDAHGAAVFIVHLHGMLFFGSANSVVEAVTLYLPYISPTSPLYPPYISPTSPLHLPHISPISPLYLPYI